MATRMQQRRGTAEQWLLADPVLAAGEIGFETDTGSFKLGDGISHWGDLDYFETTFSLQGTLDDYVPLTQKGAAGGVATLDANGFVPASQLDIDVTADINAAVSALVGGAPGVLDTLNELAAAIGDDADFFNTINGNITSGDAATLASAETYADLAEADAITTASADASAKASAAQSAAIAAAAIDATTKADAAEAAANIYTNGRETAITTAYQTYADNAETDAVSTASADATSKANAALASAQAYADTAESDAIATASGYTDTAISGVNTTISNLTTDEVDEGTTNKYFSDTLARGAVSTGDGIDYDSSTGVFSAGLGYGLEIDSNGNIQVDGDVIATDLDVQNLIGDNTVNGTTGNTVTDRIASAVSGIVDSAPGALDTLNELAAALGDDANFATTVTNSIAAKADAVHTHTLANITDVTATVTELNYVSGVTSALQTQLDGKAASSHTHAQSDITDLVTDLAAKAPLASPTFTGTVDFSNATVQGLEIPQPLHPFSMIG
jgi:hypothetical protein